MFSIVSSLSYFSGRELAVNLELTVSARLAARQPTARIQTMLLHSASYKDSGIQTQVFTAEPSPHPPKYAFFLYFLSLKFFLSYLSCFVIPVCPLSLWVVINNYHFYHLLIHSQTIDGTSYVM